MTTNGTPYFLISLALETLSSSDLTFRMSAEIGADLEISISTGLQLATCQNHFYLYTPKID